MLKMWQTGATTRQLLRQIAPNNTFRGISTPLLYHSASDGPQRHPRAGSRPQRSRNEASRGHQTNNRFQGDKGHKDDRGGNGGPHKPRNAPRPKFKTPKTLPMNGPLKLNIPTPAIQLTVDHTKAQSWTDLEVPEEIAACITAAVSGAQTPEYAQKQFLSIVNSQISLIWNSLPGCGVSTALDVALLSKRDRINVMGSKNPRDWGVNHLLVVSSELAGRQHLQRLSDMARAHNEALDTSEMVQLIHRTSPEAEKEQLALLRKFPSPQVLITTPTRLMDVLQSDFRDRLNLRQLSSLFIDDADVLLPQEKFIMKSKTQKVSSHTKPIVELGDYIASLRNGYMRSELVEFPPLQVVFAGATLKPFHKRLLASLGWSEGRPVADIGLSYHKNARAAYNTPAPDVDVRIVSKTTAKSALENVLLPPINLGLAMEELQDVVSVSSERQNYLKMKFAAIQDFYSDRYTQVMQRRHYNKDIFLDPTYFAAASDVIRSRPSERALVLTTQSFKADKYKEAFARVGVNAAHVADLDPAKMSEFCSTFFDTPVDPENEATRDLPQAIVCNLRQFKGIHLSGLSNVIVLGWESLEEEQDLSFVVNMCNSEESIKTRNNDQHRSSKRGQVSLVLDPADAQDEVLLERIAYTVAKQGVGLDEDPIEVPIQHLRSSKTSKTSKTSKPAKSADSNEKGEPAAAKPRRLGKKKAAIAERKAAREAAKAEEASSDPKITENTQQSFASTAASDTAVSSSPNDGTQSTGTSSDIEASDLKSNVKET